jgi:WD40 repeat protein
VVTASNDHTAKIWEVTTGKLLVTLGHNNIVNHAEFSPDGRLVITASHDDMAKIWAAETGNVLATLAHKDEVNYAEFSPNGQTVITASSDNTAKLWKVNGEYITTLYGHDNAVTQAKFSSNGQKLITASLDKTIRLWNAENGQPLSLFRGQVGMINYTEFNPSGDKVITASLDKTARIWTWNTDNQKFLNALKNPRLISTLQGHEGKINGAKFSPNGHQILTTSEDRTARIWDIEQGKLQMLLVGHEAGIKYAEFSPHGDKVVTASADNTARLWDVDVGNHQILIKSFMTFQHEKTVERAKFAFERQRVITTAGGAMLVWDISNEHLITKLSNLVFETSANEQRLLIISGNTVTVSSPNFQPVRIFPHSNKVDFAQLSEDGQQVISVSGKIAHL